MAHDLTYRCRLQQPQPSTLHELLAVLRRWRGMILYVTLAAALATTAYALFLPDLYTAKTMVIPAQEDKGGGSAALLGQLGGLVNLPSSALGGSSTTELYVSMLKSEAIKDPIIDRFQLMNRYRKKFRSDAYKTLDKRALVLAGKKDGIITITVDDSDPARAAQMANAYVEELGRLAVRLNVTGAGQNRAFMEQRIAGAKADLALAEENLKAFQTRNKLAQVPAQTSAAIEGISDLKVKLAAQEAQLAIYRRQLTDSSQEVKNQLASVANLRSQLARLEGRGQRGSIPSIGSVPALGQEYTRLMRVLKTQEALVESLGRQYEMARLSEAKEVPPFQVILKARVPEKKSKPARCALVAKVTLLALAGSCCLAFVLTQLRRAEPGPGEDEHLLLSRCTGGPHEKLS